MGRAKDISDLKKVAISTLLKQNIYSYREIARKECVSYGTVAKIAKNLELGLSPRANKRKTAVENGRQHPVWTEKLLVPLYNIVMHPLER